MSCFCSKINCRRFRICAIVIKSTHQVIHPDSSGIGLNLEPEEHHSGISITDCRRNSSFRILGVQVISCNRDYIFSFCNWIPLIQKIKPFVYILHIHIGIHCNLQVIKPAQIIILRIYSNHLVIIVAGKFQCISLYRVFRGNLHSLCPDLLIVIKVRKLYLPCAINDDFFFSLIFKAIPRRICNNIFSILFCHKGVICISLSFCNGNLCIGKFDFIFCTKHLSALVFPCDIRNGNCIPFFYHHILSARRKYDFGTFRVRNLHI